MDKQELLAAVRQLSSNKQITHEELAQAFAAGQLAPAQGSDVMQSRLKLSDILYYIGGAIIFLGVAFLVGQNWDSFGSALRIFIALGSMIAAFVVAAVLHRYENFKKVAQAFFLLTGLLAPLGIEVTLKEMGLDLSADSVQLLAALLMSAILLGSFYYFKQTVLLLFGIIYSTAVFHYALSLVIGANLSYQSRETAIKYEFLVIGSVYLILGYYLLTSLQKALSGVLYSFGSLAFLGSTMALGGFSPNQNAFWELVYPLLVFGFIFASVSLKSRAMLVFGTLFLIGYIFKLTGEYFSSSLGWPLALVLAGLAIIGIGFYAVKLNKQYFTRHI